MSKSKTKGDGKKDEIHIFISKAPDDPDKKKEWAGQMLRVQVALYIDDPRGAHCAQCKKRITTVDDFIDRNPYRGFGDSWEEMFVDKACWLEYLVANKHRLTTKEYERLIKKHDG